LTLECQRNLTTDKCGGAMQRLKTVIHIHTNYSFDSNTTPEELLETARQRGVDCLAITDHDEIDGALAAREIGGAQIIVGEEISSADGHVIGLFLTERIPPGLRVEETAERIRAQGGLVLVPHPFASLCRDSLHADALQRLLPWVDAVEVHNAQNPLPWENWRALRFARRHGLTQFVGDDTHIRGYLAACYQRLPEFDGPTGFLTALGQAELQRGRFGPSYFAAIGAPHVRRVLWRVARLGLRVRATRAGQSTLEPIP
jgi:predicted metal-dependent phosphoesterase TrpH